MVILSVLLFRLLRRTTKIDVLANLVGDLLLNDLGTLVELSVRVFPAQSPLTRSLNHTRLTLLGTEVVPSDVGRFLEDLVDGVNEDRTHEQELQYFQVVTSGCRNSKHSCSLGSCGAPLADITLSVTYHG